MNARRRKADNEVPPSTPDTEKSWLKIRNNSRLSRFSPDPPPSPSPQPQANRKSQETSPCSTKQDAIVHAGVSSMSEDVNNSDNSPLNGIVRASHPILPHHVDSNDIIQAIDLSVDAERIDSNICLGNAKQDDSAISSTHAEATIIDPLNAILALQNLPLPRNQRLPDDSDKHSADMSKRTRENSPGLVWPQTTEEAFEKAQSVFEASPGTQYTFNNQTLYHISTQPEVKTEVSKGPPVPPINRTQEGQGALLRAPLDTPQAMARATRHTVQPRTIRVNPSDNMMGLPPQIQSNIPQQMPRQIPNNVPRQPNAPSQTVYNSMPAPQSTFTIPPTHPPNSFVGPYPRPLRHLARPEQPLSTNPTLTQPLRPGDRVHLLDASRNDPGDTTWKITSISPAGIYTIIPNATPRTCSEPDRLVRAPLMVGDVVSVYHQEIQTGVEGNQVFRSIKSGFGQVVRCYVVGGGRKYDVLREDEVGRGVVEKGLGDGDVGMFEMGDQIGSVRLLGGAGGTAAGGVRR